MAVVHCGYKPLSHFNNNVKAALLAKTKNAKVFGRPWWHRQCDTIPDMLLEEAVSSHRQSKQLVHPLEHVNVRLFLHGYNLWERQAEHLY